MGCFAMAFLIARLCSRYGYKVNMAAMDEEKMDVVVQVKREQAKKVEPPKMHTDLPASMHDFLTAAGTNSTRYSHITAICHQADVVNSCRLSNHWQKTKSKKRFNALSKVLESGIHYRSTSKMLRPFTIFKRVIKPFLRVRQNAT